MNHYRHPLKVFFTAFLSVYFSGALQAQTKTDSLMQQFQSGNALKKVKICIELTTKIYYYQPDSCIKYGKIGMGLIRKNKIKDPQLKIAVYKSLAFGYENKGDRNRANKIYLAALDVAKKNKLPEYEADIYQLTGALNFRIPDYGTSLKYYLKALEINQRLKRKKKVVENQYIIGNIYISIGEYENSLHYQREALELALEIDDKVSQSHCYDQIASIYTALGKDDSVLLLYQKAYSLRKEIGIPDLLMYSFNNLGDWHKRKKEYNEALDYYMKFYRLTDSLNVPIAKAVASGQLGDVYFYLKNYLLAEKYINEGLKLAEEYGYLEVIKSSYDQLMDIYFAKGDYKKAFEYQEKKYIMKDSILNEQKNKDIAELQTKYETGKKELKLLSIKKRLTESKLKSKEKDLELKEANQQSEQNKWIFIGVSGSLLIILSFIIYSLRQNRKAKTALQEKNDRIGIQKKELEEKQKEITDSINYAKRIQYSLLASENLLNKNLPQHFVLFKPKDIVSGDFYWGTEKNDGNESGFYLAVCDSTGHGVPGAFMSLLNISFLNEAINEKKISEPNEIFDHVRIRLIENMGGGKDGMDGILIRINGRKFSYCSANNRSVLIRNGSVVDLNTDKMPVGYDEKMDHFNRHDLETRKGDMIYFFTDGYADQFGGDKAKKMKVSNFKKILAGIDAENPARQREILLEKFEDWKGNLEQVDDVCVIGIRI